MHFYLWWINYIFILIKGNLENEIHYGVRLDNDLNVDNPTKDFVDSGMGGLSNLTKASFYFC